MACGPVLCRCCVVVLSLLCGTPRYNPPDYTHPTVLTGPFWADKVTEFDAIEFNQIDANNVDRTSFEGVYKFDPVTQMPLNPRVRWLGHD